MNTQWEKWNGLHETPEQQKRLASARKAPCTPLSVNPATCSGTFSGSSGMYNTTLESCSCVDFSRRKLPCKHMYRLAIELGAVSGTAAADPAKIRVPRGCRISFSDAIELIESLPVTAQILYFDFLEQYIYIGKRPNIALLRSDDLDTLFAHGCIVSVDDTRALLAYYPRNQLNKLLGEHGYSGFSKNLRHEVLIDWCLANVRDVPALCSTLISVSLPAAFEGTEKKVREYLRRKYKHESYFHDCWRAIDDSPAIRVHDGRAYYDFPDDEITAQLVKHGYSRCDSCD